MDSITPGRQANQNGKWVEEDIRMRISRLGYPQIKQMSESDSFEGAYFVHQCKKTFRGRTGQFLNVDFYLYHPVKHPQGLIIESKYQGGGGSADEKLEHTIANLRYIGIPAILILSGDGWRSHIVQYHVRQQDAQVKVWFWNDFLKAVHWGQI